MRYFTYAASYAADIYFAIDYAALKAFRRHAASCQMLFASLAATPFSRRRYAAISFSAMPPMPAAANRH
jgi:hypothetical protein